MTIKEWVQARLKGLSLHICREKMQLTGNGYFSDAKESIIQDIILISYTATGYLISEGDIACKISEYMVKS